MSLPYREWSNISVVTILNQSADNKNNDITKWTQDHLVYGKGDTGFLGHYTPSTNLFKHWHIIFKPFSSNFALMDSMDECIDYGFWFTLGLDTNTSGSTQLVFKPTVLNHPAAPNGWSKTLANGKYYDGVNSWGTFPPGTFYHFFAPTVQMADMPYSKVLWVEAYQTGIRGNEDQEHFFRNGVRVFLANYAGGSNTPFPVGEATTCWAQMQKIRVNYLNAVVNSLSRGRMLPAGGIQLVLSGIGFNQADTEIASADRFPYNNSTPDWSSFVDFIDFIGQQGQGTTTLSKAAVDFVINSDTQITIPSMPALSLGTYHIRLRKENVGPYGAGINATSYVGDWIADEDGQCQQGSRFNFLVSETEAVSAGRILLTSWKFKRGEFEVSKWYAPIDVRTTDIFYDGRILGSSPITRAVNDRTGLFETSSMTMELANTDKEFSKLLAKYLLKNQIVEIASAIIGQPAAWASPIIRMVVDDYDLKGPTFSVQLKDIIHKYFQKRVPAYRCFEDEYPNIHPDHIGRRMPEILGNASLTTGEAPGAVEAIYVDTVNYKYLAGRGSLHAVPQVYSDGALQATPANYSITYEDGGRTYIKFTTDQGANKITFNAEGYMLNGWSSTNGYIQNPAYVLAFFLAFLAELPVELLNLSSFDKLADLFETYEAEKSGKLILQDERESKDVLQELLFTYGTKGFNAVDGRFKVERKDISNYTTSLILFEQLDLLSPAQRNMNLNQTVNFAKPQFDYFPTANFFKSGTEGSRQVSIDDFEAEIEPSPEWSFPWITSEAWVKQRISEELSKLSYGNQKLVISIPLQRLTDIDVHSNFRFQDPFGLSITGLGESGRYYYVESITYDHEGQKIDIVAVDLQWLLRQYFVLGDENALAALWADAGESDRMYGYLCNEATGKFADDEPGKLLINESVIS